MCDHIINTFFQERKRALEADRQARVEELLMKRREQEARIEQQRHEKERGGEDAAREERARSASCPAKHTESWLR